MPPLYYILWKLPGVFPASHGEESADQVLPDHGIMAYQLIGSDTEAIYGNT